MAVDLNIPATADEEDGPFEGLPHGLEHHPLLEPTLWKMEMEHILLTSTWQHMNQVRNFGRPQDIFVMHAYTWFALVSDFTSEFSHSSM